MSLERVIQLGKTQSVQAILARHTFMAAYWRFRAFKANYLPAISFRTTPINFNRTISQRFDVNRNIDVYLPQRNIHSSANISISQNIGFSGGTIFLGSDIGRLQNFGDNPFINYSVAPLRLGISQPLFGFNSLKWEKQLEPLAYRLAKQQYIGDLEAISLSVIELFFELASAQISYQLAHTNVATADTLLTFARDRLTIGTITQDDVLELELRLVEAEVNLNSTKLILQKTQSALKVFLNLPIEQSIQLILPKELPQVNLYQSLLLDLARTNHPDYLSVQKQELEADQEVDRIQKENRFQARIEASLGLNQSNERISTALASLLDQEIMLVSLHIPLLDWGRRQGQYKMAKSNREVAYASAKQARIDFEQEILIKLAEYPILERQVGYREQAQNLADSRYEITRQRFLLGNVDLLKLTSALQAKNQAKRLYLDALRDYWRCYHSLRYLCLYDLEKEEVLEIELKELSQ